MKTKLLMNNYAAQADGTIECNSKRRHSNVALVRIVLDTDTKQNREHAEAVLAVAIAESPGALVGRAGNEIIAVYRVESANGYQSYSNGEGAYPDALDGQREATRKFQGLTVTAESSGAFTAAAYSWTDKRSPATVHRDLLPWAYSYIFTDVMRAARDIAGYPPAPESEFQRAVRERHERIVRGEEQLPGALTPEQIVEAEDERLAARAWEGIRPTDGPIAAIIHSAIQRIKRRKAEANA